MFGRKAIVRLSGVVAILAWLVMMITDTIILFGEINQLNSGIYPRLPIISLTIFILALFLFFRFKIEKAESINFLDMLWSVFATGLLTTVASLLLRLLFLLLGDTKLANNYLFLNAVYLINLSLFAAFLIHTFIVWKRLILYQKSKFLLRTWSIFEYALLISLILNIFYNELSSWPSLLNYYWIVLILLGLFLSANMKWVAYLSFRQKWKGILLIGLALFYLGYFSWTVVSLGVDVDLEYFNLSFINFRSHIFLLALTAFIFIYGLFSLLVILFNLPTTGVFEQKLEEVMNFQRLSQSIQTEQSEERVYDILLESSVSTVFADSAWLEINNNGNSEYYSYKIDKEEIDSLKRNAAASKKKLPYNTAEKGLMEKYPSALNGSRFRSVMAHPINIKSGQLGTLVLLKEVTDGFNKEMAQIIRTFTNQAAISIENFRLLKEALQNERYKEELKIAKRVQESLLPRKLHASGDFTISAFSEAADEVGGDYYDTYSISEGKVAVIIGDVSGKGTSAAFNMSQMKGVFHSLVQLDPEPVEFLSKANKALSECLERSSFITASYFIIDSAKKEVRFSRAGHCPTIYYDSATKKADFFKNKGLGLGILRNGEFSSYLQMNAIKYKPGDLIVLYTDGIVEASNSRKEMYGYDRLKNVVEKAATGDIKFIRASVIESLYRFTGSERIDDDYTLLIIKFK